MQNGDNCVCSLGERGTRGLQGNGQNTKKKLK